MKPAVLLNPEFSTSFIRSNQFLLLLVFLSGLLSPLGFAPFHLPVVTLLSLALFYSILDKRTPKQALSCGFFYGLGFFGSGVSWVIISIHDYGNLNYPISGLVTLIFIIYLALYPALVAYLFQLMHLPKKKLLNCFLFSCLWCSSEFLRSALFSGFPWLLIGTSQIDTPLKYLLPIIGINGVSLLCLLASCFLAQALKEQVFKRAFYTVAFVLVLITPSALKNVHWNRVDAASISVGVVQANLAMRDKWDDSLFWNLLNYYEKQIMSLLGIDLIILPESAIPLPSSYLDEYLDRLNQNALKFNSSLVLGILEPTDDSETAYNNSIISLGKAQGTYIKQQLVPFGEYIPKPFKAINQWLNLPEPNIVAKKSTQELMHIARHPVASLICYEIAYPQILRKQMPLAEWIISISDNGWFGHSLASYQQLQMAQILSILTGRYQVVANNDGLSSVINSQGDIEASLPAFSSGTLKSTVHTASGVTPWIIWGNYPAVLFCFFFFLLFFFLKHKAFQRQ